MRHTLRVGMPEPCEAKQGFDHMGEALTGRHFHAHAGVSVVRIPPVVPYIRLDGGGLSLAKNARPSAVLHGQFTFKNGETFDYPGMAVFADDPRSDTREQFGNRTALGVLVGKLKNRGALPVMGFSTRPSLMIVGCSSTESRSACESFSTMMKGE